MTGTLKLTSAQRQRLEYHARKAAGLCVDCGDEKETADRVRCDDCARKLNVYQKRWSLTAHGRRTDAASVKRRYHADAEHRERHKQRMRERYHALKVAGICVRCGQEPQQDDCLECKLCQSGVSRRSERLRRPKLAEVRDPEPRRIMMRERLLAGMRFMDWTTSQDIAEALGLDDAERNSAQQTLGRMVKHGLAERTEFTPYHYKLTQAGRAASDAIRNRRAA